MNKRNKGLVLCGVMAAFCMALAAPVTMQASEADTIAEGVYIGNIYVGGMTETEAVAAVEAYIAQAGEAELMLCAGDRSISVPAESLGITFSEANVVGEAIDVGRSGSLIKRYKDKKDLEYGDKVIALELSVDSQAVSELLEEKASELNQEAVDNGLVREDGEFTIIKGEQGIEVNTEESIAAIEDYISHEWDGGDAEIELVAEIVEPRGSEEELAQITDLLGSYTTNYSDSGTNRCTNISVAAGKINGTLLYPGEEFSVYEAIGPLDAANGYELAGAYENGQTVESYGGGVCQVSSTLYNAVILAELEVTQRSNHSMIVSYVKPSMDAAIAGDYKDLRFVNNYDIPIYIEGYTVGKNVYFNIYGHETRAENRVVTYESEVVSQEDPGTQFVATTDPAGYIAVVQSKHVGYVARLWKVVTVDGVEESREVYNKSTYKASPKIVNVGTASEDPNVSAVIGAALATGDEATIYAAVAPYTANASAVVAPVQETQQQTVEEQSIVGTVDESQVTSAETTQEQQSSAEAETAQEQSQSVEAETTQDESQPAEGEQ